MTSIPSRWFSYSLRTLFVAITVFTAIVACWFAFTSWATASVIYSVEADFKSMPANDHEFMAWLRNQPGVVPHTVHIDRRKGTALIVTFVMSRNLSGLPEFPDLEQKSKALGYLGRNIAFRDSDITDD